LPEQGTDSFDEVCDPAELGTVVVFRSTEVRPRFRGVSFGRVPLRRANVGACTPPSFFLLVVVHFSFFFFLFSFFFFLFSFSFWGPFFLSFRFYLPSFFWLAPEAT
jgi:hypothetical protein